ncbi:MAG: 2-phosphosulfolactate phosphatase, partial [Thermomicrobiales bacterium]
DSVLASLAPHIARGACIIPWPTRGESAAQQAAAHGALLAERRFADGAGGAYSLSPASLLTIPAGTRLVLPSPNGARLALAAAARGATVLIGCLRNARAVADACREIGAPVTVVAAGERWPHDGSLRVALEDHLGAGAILSEFIGPNDVSEAGAAVALFRAMQPELRQTLHACASGQELLARGYAEDVDLAAELDTDTVVPLLSEGRLLPR